MQSAPTESTTTAPTTSTAPTRPGRRSHARIDPDAPDRRFRPTTPLTPAQRDLATRYVPFIAKLTRKYRARRPYWADEIDSIAAIGLCKAAGTFDPAKSNIKFATYAAYLVNFEVIRHIENLTRQSRPGGLPMLTIDTDTNYYTSSYSPDALYINPDESPLAVGRPIGFEPDPPVGQSLEGQDEIEWRLNCLPDEHREICRLIHLYGMNQREVAEALGKSSSWISVLYLESLAMLRRHAKHGTIRYVSTDPGDPVLPARLPRRGDRPR